MFLTRVKCIFTQSVWEFPLRLWVPAACRPMDSILNMSLIEIYAVTSSISGRGRIRPIMYFELATGFLPVLALGLLARLALGVPLSVLAAAVLVYAALCAVLGLRWKRPARTLGAANRVTLLRGGLVCLIAGSLVVPQALVEHADIVAAVALLALALDGLDGWVARRTGSASAFGARFDMELDAFFILVLCLCLMTIGKVGAWVVAIGALRYVFVLAMRVWSWLERPLPESMRRKFICVWQVASLLLCLTSWVDAGLASVLLGVALVLLLVSFGIDTFWLHRRRHECSEAGGSGFRDAQPAEPRLLEALAGARGASHDEMVWAEPGQAQPGGRP